MNNSGSTFTVNMASINGHVEEAIQAILDANSSGLIDCCYCLNQYWLTGSPQKTLHALLRFNESRIDYVIIDEKSFSTAEKQLATEQGLQTLSVNREVPLIDLTQALTLKPVTIAKPWGKEIWFTGIEARGVSLVESGNSSQPLPYILQLLPKQLLDEQELILLKILSPHAEDNLGDLYFELHEEKREVYIVTRIDNTAWPDGKGGIRFGFSQQKLATFSDQAAFFQAYADATAEYKLIRDEIDALHSDNKQVPDALVKTEANSRTQMNSFLHIKTLQLGDVVRVPPLFPHGLLHGVEVVEFQTPVYERKILSFGQKVLTQTHWDTQEALKLMKDVLSPNERCDKLEIVSDQDGLIIEQAVQFDQFSVWRISSTDAAMFDAARSATYGLFMVVTGSVSVGERNFSAGDVALLSHQSNKKQLLLSAASVLLYAVPRLV